ncbi:hypothetical protein [Saccharibacillus qingshengii]|uniref:hypothetical protein n=1 Tax=Saccharibacillus qingshengii TaxID=1763540 RepID=UPI0015537E86|nr:hypothetical protein [Saccharibacillus qingshengii]
MKRWREEKGSALVMVMFMMLILTLLGVTILSATVAGSRRTLTRENDIQSLQLTQKVLDESVAFISTKLNARVAQPSFDAKNLKIEIENIVNTIPVNPDGIPESKDNVQTSVLPGASGSLIVRPTVVADFPDDDSLRAGTAYTVTLKAAGIVNDVKRTLTQEVKINMYPDFLKYAFGSEQNLILNGAPYINGNIYAGSNLIVTNRPEYVYEGHKLDTTSLYPKMVTGGLVFIQGLDRFLSGDQKDRVTPIIAEGDAKVEDRVKQALGIGVSQLQIKDRQKFVRINVEESFIDKLAEALTYTGASSSDLLARYKSEGASPSASMSAVVNSLQDTGIKVLEMPKPAKIEPLPVLENPETATTAQILKHNQEVAKVIEDNQKETDRYNREIGTLENELRSLSSTAVFKGDLALDGKIFSTLGAKNKKNWLIVNGSLTLAGEEQPTNVLGNVLVTGSVRFTNTVNVDSTMFVMGDTTIEDATILGKEEDGQKKEIVLISKGSVLLNRVDAFKNNAAVQTLRGFFYTDSTAVLYGVGSNFVLDGGFFAKGNLTINAVIGNSAKGDGDIAFATQGPDGSQASDSRFKVHYNDDVYAHQRIGLPQVEQVSLSVGKLQLE